MNPTMKKLMRESESIKDKTGLKVLLVISSLGMGGAETWIMALLKYYSDHFNDVGFHVQVDICLTSGLKGQFDDKAITYGVGLHYIEFSRRNWKNFVARFRSLLSTEDYDVIHDHQDCLAGIHFLIGVGVLPKLRIAHVHNTIIHINSYASGIGRRLTVALGKFSLAALSTHILGTSDKVLRDYSFNSILFSGVSKKALHCGFDVSEFEGDYSLCHKNICGEFGWPYDSKIILFVGRLESNQDQKNPGFAIDVFKKCVERTSSLRLLMVGDTGSSRDMWENKINSLGLTEYVCLAGVRNDLNAIMPGADLLLFPSKAEGLGMVNVEAQASGVRVLASDSTPRECVVLADMVTFKALEDGMESWANELIDLLSKPRADRTKCIKEVEASAFSISKSFSNLIEIYSSGRN
ncbi:glycosyltransferase family 1 protein [Mariprofundus erugo]|uniref:glycosyltransferase n=1 Tax=Mariprofundus erugo TaxID=2528639 RepID=UPI0010FDECC2|nr:glycosyltransferase [Mariprofundus erugo]TLS78404.1 glycosyltransferase family 1 protein [Mariprofundus erugo]